MGYGGFGGGGFGGGNMQQLMKQAQKMQEEMMQTRAKIDATEFTSNAGGGMVSVTLFGNKKMKGIKIKPEVIDPDDPEMLEDLITAAFNDCVAKIALTEKEELPQLPV